MTLADEVNANVHFSVSSAPEHVSFLLVEADSPAAVARLANSIPMRQSFDVVPVMCDEKLYELGKQMAAQQ